jgi:hypothetical protein
VSITCLTVIDAAFARSLQNDPGTTATHKELIGVIDRYMRGLYAQIAREDPTYFGTSASVNGSSGAWTRPPEAEVVFHIANASGAEVNVMPFKHREDEVPPRVYRLGNIYRTVGLTGDPSGSETLTFFYSKKHPNLNLNAQASDNLLDSTFPSQFLDLPVVAVAKYMALKEGRTGELQALALEEKEQMAIFLTHVENQARGVKSRHGGPRLTPNRAEPR